jgi:hypothetical protein
MYFNAGEQQFFIADVLLFYFVSVGVKRKSKVPMYYSAVDKCEWLMACVELPSSDSQRLCSLLIELAVSYLNNSRLTVSYDYRFVRTIGVCDYRAMYTYKCGLFEQCFDLCNNIVRTALSSSDDIICRVVELLETDLLILMDGDIMSLLGCAKLCRAFGMHPDQTESIYQLTLIIYLLM